jgi:hypothetical protein
MDFWPGLELGHEVSPKAEGESDNRQGRISKPAGGKNRAASNVEVRHVMDLAIGIDHPFPWIVVHPGGAEEVMRTAESSRWRADRFLHGRESANAGGSQVLTKYLLRLADAAQIQLVPTPEQFGLPLLESVCLLLQHDAIGGIWGLFDERVNPKLTEASFKPAQFRPSATTLRVIIFEQSLTKRTGRFTANLR